MLGNFWSSTVSERGLPAVPLSPGDLEGEAEVVGFFSPAPGAGAATLACLCALHAAGEGRNVALADLCPRGKVRAYMGLTPDVCPASVLDMEGVDVPEEVNKAGVLHPRGVFVVPSVARTLDVVQVDTRLSIKAVSLLKRAFDLVFVVLGPLYGNGWAVAMVCDRLFAVVRPCRVDLDLYAEDAELLERLGCGGKTRVVLNQATLPGAIKEEDVRKVLTPEVTLPFLSEVQAGSNKRYLVVSKKVRKLLSPVFSGGKQTSSRKETSTGGLIEGGSDAGERAGSQGRADLAPAVPAAAGGEE